MQDMEILISKTYWNIKIEFQKKTPAPYVKEMLDAAMFYVNRILKEFKVLVHFISFIIIIFASLAFTRGIFLLLDLSYP